jgi:hypothetical protein
MRIAHAHILEVVNFADSDLRGAAGFSPDATVNTRNTIWPDGSIQGLVLSAGETLVIHNNPIPITVNTIATFDPAATVQFMLTNNWTSTIGFAEGLTPELSGTLQLKFDDGVHLASQMGRTFNLFNWNGAKPSGAFKVSSPYKWNLSQLYTTGKVTLLKRRSLAMSTTTAMLMAPWPYWP